MPNGRTVEKESFYAYVPVDHDWLLLLALLVHVSQVEPVGQLEVELDRGALVLPPQGVHQGDVNLGPVEGTVSGVQLPGDFHLVQGLGERLEEREKRGIKEL